MSTWRKGDQCVEVEVRVCGVRENWSETGEWWRSLLLGACVRVCVCEQASVLMNPEDKVWVVIKSGT